VNEQPNLHARRRAWTDVPTPVRVIACCLTWAVVLGDGVALATSYRWPLLTGWSLAHGTVVLVGLPLAIVLWLVSGARPAQVVAAFVLAFGAVALFWSRSIAAGVWTTLASLSFAALAAMSYEVQHPDRS
jgi:hypothetical protein